MTDSIEQHRITKLNLEDRRAECVKAETRAQEVEEHYLNSTQRKHEREVNQLKVRGYMVTQTNHRQCT